MAWLDNNSPVTYAEKKKQEDSTSATGPTNKKDSGKWLFRLQQLPFLKNAYHFFHNQAVFFSLNKLNKKLTAIEKSFHMMDLGDITKVTSILRELMLAKQISKRNDLIKVSKKIYLRSEELKKILLKTSRQVVENSEYQEKSLVNSINSHQHVLSLIAEHKVERLPPKSATPSRVYWRHGQDEKLVNNNYVNSLVRSATKSLLYLQTSCHTKLFNLLAKKLNLSAVKNDKDFQFCDKGFAIDGGNELVCGVSLKYQPTFTQTRQRKKVQTTFWQKEDAELHLSQFKDNELIDYINEIYFKTSSHYSNFKELLHHNQAHSLLDFIKKLEARSQIIINDQSSLTLT